MLGRRARRAVRTGHRRELLARCDEDAAAAGDAARRHEPVPPATGGCSWEIAELEGDGNYDCTWCPAKRELPDVRSEPPTGAAADQGRTVGVMPSMQVIVPSDLILDPQKLARAVANGLDGAAKGATVDFQTTTATWDHQVDFETAEPDAARQWSAPTTRSTATSTPAPGRMSS